MGQPSGKATPDAYVEAVRTAMVRDKCEISSAQIGPVQALVGHRSEFRVSWMFTRLHLLTVIAATQAITEAAIRDFVEQVDGYAKATKGQWRGMQSGVASFAALVATQADDAAKAFAEGKPKMGFAAMVRPAVVDLSTGGVHTFRGSQALGRVYQSYLRDKAELYLPLPTAVSS